MHVRRSLGSFAFSSLAFLALAGSVSAATLTWDATTTVAGAQSGVGTWNITNTNWWNGAANTNWNNTTPDAAIFPGSASTVSLGVAISAGNINFTSGYLIRSNTLTLVGSPTISAAATPTINSILAGSGFLKTNTGTLALGGANTYTGTTTLAAGVIQANNNAALGNSALSFVTSAVRLVIADGVTITNYITIGPNAGVGSLGLIMPVANSTGTLTGPITINNGAAAGGHFAAATGAFLRVNGAITSSISVSWRAGSGSFAGGGSYPMFLFTDTINLGTNNGISTQAVMQLAASSGGTFNMAGFNQTVAGLTNVNAATILNTGAGQSVLTLAMVTNQSYGGFITNNIALVKTGVGVQALRANTAYSGPTTISEGVLQLTNSGSLYNNGTGAGTVTVVSAGTLSLSRNDAFGGHAATPALTLNLDTNGVIENAATFTTLGTLVFRGGELRANGGANTNFEAYQVKGPVTVGADVMSRITGPGGLNGFTGVQVGNNNAGGQTTFTVADGAAAVDLSVETALIDGKNAANSLYVSSGFIKAGPGRMELSANNRMSGTASINSGTLALGAAGSISNGTVDVGTGGVFDVTAVSGFTVPAGMTIQGNGVVSGSVTTADGARLLPGSATGAGTLTIAGDLVLSVTAGYTNAFDLTNSFVSGANDQLNVTGFLDPASNPVLINARAPLASGTYDLIQYGTLNSAATFGPVLGNSYRDSWTLNTNTTGWIKLDVTSGVAQAIRWLPGLSADWDLATSNWVDQSTSTVTDRFYNLDTVLFDDAGAYSNAVNLTTIVRPTAVVVDSTSNYVFSGAGRIGDMLAGSTLLTKSGSGLLVIETDNDNTAGTVVSNGVLQVGNGGGKGLIGTGPIRIAAPGTVLYARSNGNFNVANVLTGNGTLILGGSTIATGESSYGFSGVNTGFVGTIVVSNGARFIADNANDIGNAALIQIKAGGGLYHSANTFGRPIEIAGLGWPEPTGLLGAMRIDGNNNWTGTVTLAGNARIGAFSANGTVSGTISGPYELEIWAGSTARSITLTPPTPNTYASLRVSSNGIVVANNTNAYSTGPVVMNGGTQRLNGINFAFSNLTSTVYGGNIQNGHASAPATFTVGLDDSSTAYGGVFANGAAGILNVTKVGAGTLTLNNASVNSGAFTVQAGTLALGATGSIAASSSLVLAGGTFDVTAKTLYSPLHVIRGSGIVSGDVAITTANTVQPGPVNGAGTISFAQNLGIAANYTNVFNLTNSFTVGGGVNDLLAIAGNLEPSNSTIAVAYTVPLSNGTYTLVTYGTKTTPFNATPVGNNSRKTWTIDETTPGQVNLVVAGIEGLGLRWNAQTSTNWDIRVGTNWYDLAGLTNTTFLESDTVLFDDNGAMTNGIALVGTLRPGSVTVSSSSNYALRGSGSISGTAGLTKDGTGTLTMAVANTYSGGTTISNGILIVGAITANPGGSSALGLAVSNSVVTINTNAVLIGFNNNWLDNTGSASGGSNAHTVVINGGKISSGGGQITGLGNITLNGGTIEVGNGFGGGWNGSYTLLGTLTVEGSVPSYIAPTAGVLAATANMQMGTGINTVGGTNTFNVADVTLDGNPDLIISASIVNGLVNKAGPGTVQIATNHNANGVSWNVNAGTLNLAHQFAVQNGTVTMDGGSLVFDSSVATNAFTLGALAAASSGAGYDIALLNNAGSPAAIALTAGGNGANTTYAGVLSGAGSLTKAGAGTMTLGGSNTYTGGTVLSGGTLAIDAISDTGESRIGNTGDVTFIGGTLRYTGAGFDQTARTVTNVGAATLDVTNSAATVLFSGLFSGPGLFTKAGPGTMVLSNVSFVTTNGYVARRGTLIFDGGSYTSTAPNVGDLIGNAAGESALVILTNEVQYYKNEHFGVGWAGNSTGIVAMYSGRLRVNQFRLGNPAGAAGAFYQFGGESYAASEIDVGYNNAGAYGFLLLAGGSMSNSSWQQAGRFGVGLTYLLGGTDSILTSGNGFVAGNNSGTGVFYFAGSTISNAGRIGIGWVGTSRGEVNVMAGSTVPAPTLGVQFNQAGTTFGVLNLNGGTVRAPALFKQVAGGYAVVNFDGGTLQAMASQPILGLTGGTTSAVDAVYVRAGGAAFDSSNHNVTVAVPLRAPTGSGVTALPAIGANSGFIGAPYVAIRGGGGTGATAVALFDLDSGSVTGLVLTSPGTDYTSEPTVTLFGGGPVTNTLLGTATIGAQDSGGLTKLGSGSLFLNSANTYTGLTTVSAGTLFGTGSVAGSVNVASNAAIGPAPFGSPTGTLAIAGSVTLTNDSALAALLSGTNPTLAIAGDLNTAATNLVNIVRVGAVTTGTHVLVDYAGAFGGDTNNLQLVSVPNGGQGYLQVNTIDSTVELVVTNVGTGVKWDGGVNGTWKHGGPANWKSVTAGTLAPYSALDDVLFDDTATGTYNVNLAETVQPGSLLVNNATGNYTFGGAAILGTQALVKSGAAQLTLAGANGYTGGTILNDGTLRLEAAAALGTAGQTITLNGGTLSFGGDVPGNAYAGLLANNATVVLDRATSGAGITNALGALTVGGNYELAVVAGTNSSSGEAWLTQGGTFSASTRVLTFNIATSVVYNQTGAFPGGAQNVGVIKNGEGRLILAGNSDTWDAPSPAIQLNVGALELRRAAGDVTDARAIDAASNTTLTLNQSVGTTFRSALNVKDSMTVVSESTTVGAGLTHVLGALNFLGTNATLTVLAGGNVTNGTAGVNFNTTALGTGTTINVVNPVDTNIVTVASITGIVSGVDLSLTKTGSGTLTLRGPGAMTYNGGTIVNGGVLNLSYSSSGQNIGTIRGDLTINTGAVVRGIEKSLGFPQVASGNVYTVTINGGLLEHVGASGGIGGGQTYVFNAGEFRSNLGIPSTASASLRLASSLSNLNHGVYVLAAAVPSVISGRISMDTTGRFDVQDGAADADLFVNASITDGLGTGNPPNGFTKTNTGTMVLNAPSTYKGVTSVDGGRLLVNNGTGLGTGTNALLVAAGATLGGTGVVGGTVTSDGIVAPGASAGLLTIGGDYIQNAGGSLVIELGGNVAGADYDQLVVSNSAALSGALNVSLINGFTPATSDVFVVLSASSVGGTMSATLPALPAGQGWLVGYPGNAVVLSITSAPALSGYDLAVTVVTNGLTGYQDDADGDGYANLLEYVTGGSLTNPGTQAQMSGGRTNGLLALKFFRDTNAVDATIFVEGSYTATNGADWVGVATNLAGSWGGATNVSELGVSPVNVTVEDTDPTATNRFLRLRVTRP